MGKGGKKRGCRHHGNPEGVIVTQSDDAQENVQETKKEREGEGKADWERNG